MQPVRHSEPVRLNQHQGAFSVLSVDGLLLSVSSVFLSLSGWKEGDWLGKRFSHLLHEEDVEAVQALYESAIRGQTQSAGKLRFLASDGTFVELDTTFVPRIQEEAVGDVLWLTQSGPPSLPSSFGSPSFRPLRIYRDGEGGENPIGVEQAGLLGLFHTLLANAPVGIALFDESLKFVCLNQTFSELTGFSPEQQLGQPLLAVMPRLGLLLEPSLRKALVKGHALTNQEVPLQKFSLSEFSRWGLLSFYPVPDGHGGACGVAAVAIDITDRKRAERALRESEDRFRLAVDAAQLGTWDLDFETGRMIWSDQAKVIYGLSSGADLTQKNFMKWIHHEDFDRTREAIERAKDPATGGDFQIEYRVIDPEKKTHWVSARGRVSFDESGTPLRFIGTVLDVTERKEAEAVLNTLSEELSRSNRALADFAHTAAHDLKEPLRMISSFVKLLSSRYRGKLDKDADEYFGYVTSGAERMGHLIDSILEYARAGRTLLNLKKVNCEAILQTVLRNLSVALEEARVEITYDRMPLVCGSEPLVFQVFQNLIANALKFRNGPRPRIHISASPEEERWVFKISDNGIGIRADLIDSIFSPFRKLHSSSLYAGSGLGLAICKQNVERHGGRIWATSEEGRGSSFYFTLPSLKGSES